MSERPRFTLELTLRDNHTGETLHHAIGLDEEVRISARAVDEMKLGASIGAAIMPMEATVTLMNRREMRKDLFVQAGRRLAAQMAERMEDAEGWHDTSRIDPARKSLGGKW